MHKGISIGGSGGVARSLPGWPAAHELQDVLGSDDMHIGAIYPYNEAEARKVTDITHQKLQAFA